MTKTETTKYLLYDKDGVLKAIHEHVRDTKTGEKRGCYWKRPNGQSGLNGTPLADLPLYGIDLLDTEAMLTVLVEGEPARDALAEALADTGVGVVGTVTGASGTPSPAVLEALRGHEVTLWPDADGPGRAHMARIAERLEGIAAKVRLYEWPEAEKGDDAADHPAVKSRSEKALDRLLNDLCGAPEYAPPASTNTRRPTAPPTYNLSDVGNAERFVDMHGERVRWCPHPKAFLVYDGKRWCRDEYGEVVKLAHETARSLHRDAANEPDTSKQREIAKFAVASQNESRVKGMLSQAKPYLGVGVEDLDRDPWAVNCLNGTLDLKTATLRPHDPSDLVSKIVPVEYDPDADCPRFKQFLKEILVDDEIVAFVRRFAGYSLTGDTRERCIAILHGGGKNGKSTLVELLNDLLGDYARNTSPETILTKRYEGVGNDVAALKGARFVSTAEIEKDRRLAESKVKQLTGSDTVTARFLFGEPFDFRPQFKLWMSTNNKPVIAGDDDAIWDRIRLIPFTRRFEGTQADEKLPEKLREEMPGILAWAVRGCLDWQWEGLGEPDKVKDATQEYRAEMDVLADFMRERCVVSPNVWCIFADLYSAYEEWCKESGEEAESKRRFGARLKERGFLPDNGTRNVAVRRGIALRDDRGPEDGPRVNQQPPENTSKDASRDAPEVNYGEGVNERTRNVNPQNTCKTGVFSERVNESYPKNKTFGLDSLVREPFGNTLTNVNSLTPGPPRDSKKPQTGPGRRLSEEEARQVQRLVSEGMEAKLARAAVLGEAGII